ncbi:putative transcription factor C2H2 family [Rosa chinensis]|uniref:RING-type E3 ubiquitin transferase n=1 Tax=Rosa chinensis TaxID=74649 RepID=A0A2P6PZZ8_ROSCH|nr:E3 ubiquitin-protein ligase RNF181 [Rosa chinensis]PRQ27501.1 putative transcription factor C2H2 family [Rosa chinensis]
MDKLVDKLARYLSDTVGVEEDQHPCIILKTVEMIQAAVHDRVIDVQISDITFIEQEPEPEEESELEESEPEEESEQEEESETEEDSEQEGFEDLDDTSYGDNLTPASESFMEDLKKLRVLGSELEMLGQTPNCAICLEVLAEEGYDDQLITITRLPCLHYYHRDCIIKWMMINNLCPVCRRQNVEAGEIRNNLPS